LAECLEQEFATKRPPEFLWIGNHKRETFFGSEIGRFVGVSEHTASGVNLLRLQVVVRWGGDTTRQIR
jgi:hypothetical protein